MALSYLNGLKRECTKNENLLSSCNLHWLLNNIFLNILQNITMFMLFLRILTPPAFFRMKNFWPDFFQEKCRMVRFRKTRKLTMENRLSGELKIYKVWMIKYAGIMLHYASIMLHFFFKDPTEINMLPNKNRISYNLRIVRPQIKKL